MLCFSISVKQIFRKVNVLMAAIGTKLTGHEKHHCNTEWGTADRFNADAQDQASNEIQAHKHG